MNYSAFARCFCFVLFLHFAFCQHELLDFCIQSECVKEMIMEAGGGEKVHAPAVFFNLLYCASPDRVYLNSRLTVMYFGSHRKPKLLWRMDIDPTSRWSVTIEHGRGGGPVGAPPCSGTTNPHVRYSPIGCTSQSSQADSTLHIQVNKYHGCMQVQNFDLANLHMSMLW